jgi:hypothetical protein
MDMSETRVGKYLKRKNVKEKGEKGDNGGLVDKENG